LRRSSCSGAGSAASSLSSPTIGLVTDGLYKIIRNPSYLGLVVNALGWSLAFRSGVGVALTLLMIVPLVARMNAEERLLADQLERNTKPIARERGG
jgi:protein-S-isoprenylcysteine O-methyltransferase Ste14